MQSPRFYAPDLDPESGHVALSSDESHHLVRVMRLVAGDHATIFDGRGRAYSARVERADRERAVLRIVDALPAQAEPAVPITLVQAVLKGDKMDGVIRDATMAGVRRIAPVVTERSQIRVAALKRGHAFDRWQRVAISSAKQCGQNRLPEIDLARPFRDWLASAGGGLTLLLTEPSSAFGSTQPLRKVLEQHQPAAVSCVVGPEGGWSPQEHETATTAGCVAVSFGPMTLRADVAGLVAAAILAFAFESISPAQK
jgi:16S rRNA (uracil1498-N3)-methyltransferase